MKNLDETIFTMRFERTDNDTISDAVDHLRDYRDLLQILKRMKKDFDFLTKQYELEDNPPLDWDDLKQMIGKPVYELEIAYGDGGNWKVIKDFIRDKYEYSDKENDTDEYVVYTDGSRLAKRLLFNCFVLYRKEVGYIRKREIRKLAINENA